MNVVVAGASGFIGTALVPALREHNHRVRRLVRRPDARSDEISWEPGKPLPGEVLKDVDAVINLSGENVAVGRWTTERRERILRSRIDATRTLVDAMSRSGRPPQILLNASAVGIYGDRGTEVLTELSGNGAGFLSDVCARWESEAVTVEALGVRVVRLRFGIVLDPSGGALAKMLPFFRFGLGGRLGSGEQWMSWVSRADAIAAIVRVLADSAYAGAINIVAPEPITNATFTKTLGRALHRPTRLNVPRWALRLIYGRMADEALLASVRAIPEKLEDTGFRFRHRSVEESLKAMLW